MFPYFIKTLCISITLVLTYTSHVRADNVQFDVTQNTQEKAGFFERLRKMKPATADPEYQKEQDNKAPLIQLPIPSKPADQPAPVAAPEVSQSRSTSEDGTPLPRPRGQSAQPEVTISPATDPIAEARAQQNDLLDQISTEYNALETLQGNFTQVGPDGSRATGVFFIRKPGRVRFIYNPPSKLDIIADGKSVLVKDGKSGTNDLYLINQTPLRYLLSRRIDLKNDSARVQAKADQELLEVKITDKTLITQGELTLYFNERDFSLQQWTVVDAQGLETAVAVTNLEINQPIDRQTFVIDYERIRQNKR